MIYEFLYTNKPTDILIMSVNIIATITFFGFFLLFYISSRPPKKNSISKTYSYDAELRKHVAVSETIMNSQPRTKQDIAGITISLLLTFLFSMVSAILIYDYATSPSKNTKTTDIYRISKERNYLTFTLKKPYNHLYKTKTMEITYENPNEYVIIANQQTYKIPKKVIKE